MKLQGPIPELTIEMHDPLGGVTRYIFSETFGDIEVIRDELGSLHITVKRHMTDEHRKQQMYKRGF